MKVSRNDPCPCLSGKKFKQCCQKEQESQRSGEFLFREAEADLMERMLNFAARVFGERAIDEAWFLFLAEMTEVNFDDEDPLNLLFIPWFLYSWELEDEDEKLLPDSPLHTTIAEAFLQAERQNLTELQVAVIEGSNRPLFSFYEVLAVESGKSLLLKDLFLEEELSITEANASESLQLGDIIMAAMMQPVLGVRRALALSPFALPKEHFLDDVKEMAEATLVSLERERYDLETLRDAEPFLFSLYLDLLDEYLEENWDEDGASEEEGEDEEEDEGEEEESLSKN